MENNRDIDLSEVASPPSPPRSGRQSSPNSITSSSNTQEATNNATTTDNNNTSISLDVPASTEDIDIKVSKKYGVMKNMNIMDQLVNVYKSNQISVSMQSEFLADSSITTSLFNAGTELFSDPIDEVKAEYSGDFHNFGNYPQPNHFETQPPTQDDDDEEPQLHTLQTPQQLLEEQQQKQQQQLQQQQQQYQQYPPTSSTAPPPDTTTTTNTQQHSEQLLQTGYDHSNTYANQNHYASTSTPTPTTASSSAANTVYNSQFSGSHNNSNNSTSGSGAPMQPPTSGLGRGAPGQPRKRRTSHANNVLGSAQAGVESLESMYLNEVRKKNILLAEQLEIARKRMQLEERKVNLLERFFPQCLEMQEQILGKLNSNT